MVYVLHFFNLTFNNYYRGSTFRESLQHIGEIRSLVPCTVPVMALTATATHSLRLDLARFIGLKNPIMIVQPPCKSNLMYCVTKFLSIETNFTPLLEKLRKERVMFPRTIIYCRTMEDTANLLCIFSKKTRNGLYRASRSTQFVKV